MGSSVLLTTKMEREDLVAASCSSTGMVGEYRRRFLLVTIQFLPTNVVALLEQLRSANPSSLPQTKADGWFLSG